jgi:magnesium-transporting ATPase (P-type)
MTLAQIAARGAVFARMSPEHKQQLVQELQAIGYCVGKKIHIFLDLIVGK